MLMNRKERKPMTLRDARTMESSAAEQALKKKTQRRIFRWSSALLGSLLAVVMFYALMKPAITLENGEKTVDSGLVCELQEHIHTEACYGYDHEESEPVYAVSRELNCAFVPHVHDETCRDASGNMICGISEVYDHVHDEYCYDQGTLVCTLQEHVTEDDTEETRVLVCDIPEAEGHVHTDDCYTTTWFTDEDPICGLQEGGPHIHTDECFGPVLICEEDHEHTDACFADGLICGLEEGVSHTHTLECYPSIRELTCGQTETEGHVHTEDCYAILTVPVERHVHTDACYEDGRLVCGQVEVKAHQHDASCWRDVQILVSGGHRHNEECTKVLICGMQEHTHTEACFTGEAAGTEEDAPVSTGENTENLSLNPEEELLAEDSGEMDSLSEEETDSDAAENGMTVSENSEGMISEAADAASSQAAAGNETANAETADVTVNEPDADMSENGQEADVRPELTEDTALEDLLELEEEPVPEETTQIPAGEQDQIVPDASEELVEEADPGLEYAELIWEDEWVETEPREQAVPESTGNTEVQAETVIPDEHSGENEESDIIREETEKNSEDGQNPETPVEVFGDIRFVQDFLWTDTDRLTIYLSQDEGVRVRDILKATEIQSDNFTMDTDIAFLEMGEDYFVCRFAFTEGTVTISAGERTIVVHCVYGERSEEIPEAQAGTEDENTQVPPEEETQGTEEIEETDVPAETEEQEFSALHFVHDFAWTGTDTLELTLSRDEGALVQDILADAGLNVESVTITSDIPFLEIGEDYFACRFAFTEGTVQISAGDRTISVHCAYGQEVSAEETQPDGEEGEVPEKDETDAPEDGDISGNEEAVGPSVKVTLHGEVSDTIHAFLKTEGNEHVISLVEAGLNADTDMDEDAVTVRLFRVMEAVSDTEPEERFEVHMTDIIPLAESVPEGMELRSVNYRLLKVDAENGSVTELENFSVDADAEYCRGLSFAADSCGIYVFVCSLACTPEERYVELELDFNGADLARLTARTGISPDAARSGQRGIRAVSRPCGGPGPGAGCAYDAWR